MVTTIQAPHPREEASTRPPAAPSAGAALRRPGLGKLLGQLRGQQLARQSRESSRGDLTDARGLIAEVARHLQRLVTEPEPEPQHPAATGRQAIDQVLEVAEEVGTLLGRG